MTLDAIDGRTKPLATRAAPIVGAARAAPTTGALLETAAAALHPTATVVVPRTGTGVPRVTETDTPPAIGAIVLRATATDGQPETATGVLRGTATDALSATGMDARRATVDPLGTATARGRRIAVARPVVIAIRAALPEASVGHGRAIARAAGPLRAATVGVDARDSADVTTEIRAATVAAHDPRTSGTTVIAAHPVLLAPTATRLGCGLLAVTASGHRVLPVTADRDASPPAPAGNGRHDLRATANRDAAVARARALAMRGVRRTVTVVAPAVVDPSAAIARNVTHDPIATVDRRSVTDGRVGARPATTGSSVNSPRRSSFSANSARSVLGMTTPRSPRT
jgi:hypothetical protein